MFKLIALLKKKAGMSFEDFVEYYETTHAKLGVRVLPTAERYFRRYLSPFPAAESGERQETDYDVITEVWFKDRATFEAAMSDLSDPVIAEEIAQDEEQLFDRSRIRFFTVEEYESQLNGK